MKRILIINVNWVGDVLFSTPLIRSVRKKFPDSYIACLVVPRCRPVLELNPHINEIITYDEDGEHGGFWGKIKLIRTLRAKKFDAAFILHRSFTRALISFASGIKKRIGYGTKKRSFLLTDVVKSQPSEIHKVDYFLNIAEKGGVSVSDRDYDFVFSKLDKERIDEILEAAGVHKNDKLVIINPGGNWDLKRWPKENFIKLADSLAKNLDVKIAISGAGKDRVLGDEIKSAMKEIAVNLCGKTSLGELGALMKRADVVISNDSGPMHVAASMKTPLIALFGPTSSEITGPCGSGKKKVLWKDIGCKTPCYKLTCIDNRCMKAITPEEVLETVKDML